MYRWDQKLVIHHKSIIISRCNSTIFSQPPLHRLWPPPYHLWQLPHPILPYVAIFDTSLSPPPYRVCQLPRRLPTWTSCQRNIPSTSLIRTAHCLASSLWAMLRWRQWCQWSTESMSWDTMAMTQWQLPIHILQHSSLVVGSCCGEEDMVRRWREQARSMGGDVVTGEEDLRGPRRHKARTSVRSRCCRSGGSRIDVVVVLRWWRWWGKWLLEGKVRESENFYNTP